MLMLRYWFPKAVAILGLALLAGLAQPARSRAVLAETTVFASPIQAGCYLVRANQCKVHVEPFAIQMTPGKKLVSFQLVAVRMGSGLQTVIYNFRPDTSNPVPFSGSSFSPSLVAKDFAAACTTSYQLFLQGQDSGDANQYNLGATATITCPKGTFITNLPLVKR